jgi:negative regulator of flagellin synthesis FlgM
MTVSRIGPLDPIQSGKKPSAVSRVPNTTEDIITISSEAMEQAERTRLEQIVAAADDIRMDRVEELKQKINDPSYLNDTILAATADKILEAWGV